MLKLPAYKSSPSRLAVELNLLDEEAGKPKKRRGLILRSSAEPKEFSKMREEQI